MLNVFLFSLIIKADTVPLKKDIECFKSVSEASLFDQGYSPHQKIKIPPDITYHAGETINGCLLLPDPNNKKKWFFYDENSAQSIQFTATDEIFFISSDGKTQVGIQHLFKKSTNEFYKESFGKEFENLGVYEKKNPFFLDKLKEYKKEPVTIHLSKGIQNKAMSAFNAELVRRLGGVHQRFLEERHDDNNSQVGDEAWKAEHVGALKKCEHIEDLDVQKALQGQRRKFKIPESSKNKNKPAHSDGST